MIIDAHMHLGDFLHEDGINIVGKRLPMPSKFNIQEFEEKVLRFNSNALTRPLFEKLDDQYTLSVSNRIKAGTLDNYRKHRNVLARWSKKLFGDSKVYCYCMPIAPYVTFRDVYEATRKINSLRSFTSINPLVSIDEACKEILDDSESFYGLKLHPIIQGIPFNSDRTFAVLDIMNKLQKPVLFHAGASRYYLGSEKYRQHCELDDIKAATDMVKRYPDITFVIAHAGIAEYRDWAAALSKCENVYFDITVQSVKTIRELVSFYGEDRVLFATDWPCVNDKCTLQIVRKALTDQQLEKCMYLNAMRIYKA